jgi:hypothetical protein
VEHVLAAVSGLEIDDITIRMDASEPPILDGSALPFVEALSSAGLAMHGGRPAVLALSERVHVIDGDSVYDAYPAPVLSLEVTIEFPHPLIGRQTGSYSISRDAFVRDLAPARTFGFTHEVEELRGKVPAVESAPLRLSLRNPYPNPARGEVLLRFGQPTEGPSRLRVFDVQGREIARLHDGRGVAGWRDMTWDGGRASGRVAPSGVYFAVLEQDGEVVRKKFVLAR